MAMEIDESKQSSSGLEFKLHPVSTTMLSLLSLLAMWGASCLLAQDRDG